MEAVAIESMFTGEWSLIDHPATGARAIARGGKQVALFGGAGGAYDIAVTDASEMLALIQHIQSLGGSALREPEVEGQGMPTRRDVVAGLFTLAISLVGTGCAGFKDGVFRFDETGTYKQGTSQASTTTAPDGSRKTLRTAEPAAVPDAALVAARGAGTPEARAQAVVAALEGAAWRAMDPTKLDNLPRPADWAMKDEKALEPAMRRFLSDPSKVDPALGPLNVRMASDQAADLSDHERAEVMLDYHLLEQATRLRPRAEVSQYGRWSHLLDEAQRSGALDDMEAMRLRAMGAAWSAADTPLTDTSELTTADRRFVGALRIVQLTRSGRASTAELENALALLS